MELGLAFGLVAFGSLNFTSPVLFLVAIPFLLALVASIWMPRNKKRGKIEFSDVSYFSEVGSVKTRKFSNKRILSLFLIILLSVSLLAGPELIGREQVEETTTTQYMRTVIVVMDISGSMAYKASSSSGDNRTNFDVVRDALIDFIETEDSMRIGVIFYSKEPLQYRRPTEDLDSLVKDLGSLRLVRLRSKEEGTFESRQLSHMSQGTDTIPALYMASKALEDLNETSGLESAALILLSDLQDNLGAISDVLEELSRVDVKTYIIASRTERRVNDIRRVHFRENNNVRIFSAMEENEIKEAYAAISELEAAPIVLKSTVSNKRDVGPEAALILFIAFLLFIFIAEAVSPRMRKK